MILGKLKPILFDNFTGRDALSAGQGADSQEQQPSAGGFGKLPLGTPVLPTLKAVSLAIIIALELMLFFFSLIEKFFPIHISPLKTGQCKTAKGSR